MKLVMKITVYTTSDCQFSKAEKDYLSANSFSYEEKNLETNKEFLTEMLAVSNNFAGTPVTRIEKDDGSIEVLKGFTKEEFDAVLGLKTANSSATAESPMVQENKQTEPTPTQVESFAPAEQTPTTPPTETTPQTVDTSFQPTTANSADSTPRLDEKLGSVLDKLEEKTEPIQPTPTNSTGSTNPAAPPADNPVIPDFSAGAAPQTIK